MRISDADWAWIIVWALRTSGHLGRILTATPAAVLEAL